MPHDPPNAWEPDPRKMGNWRAMFEQDRGGKPPDAPPPTAGGNVSREQPPDAEEFDVSVYKPWILQRGRSRPAMMLDFRRYEPRSGLFTGWAISYPCLIALEYTGGSLLSLDFGTRQIVIEGRGLDELARHIEEATVLAVHEHSAQRWPVVSAGPTVSSIRKITGEP